MTIFEVLDDVISTKSGTLLDDVDNEKEFVPFLVQRWLSMYSPSFAQVVNCTTNSYWRSFTSKQEWYKYFITIIPKSSNKRIPYIKKMKKETVKGIEKEHIQYLAERLELSQREINQYISMKQLTNKELEKVIGE
jgi:DNA polymerase III delta subunit